ncbi:maleylacetoacetate isomerase [Ottowia sp.]|jgi:maleylacetoacetate isomerase/maleylpyruvate isomerase|uniref:maleylacetoacetate isomerase n=1 Tax=Ottowia sp. TaxID=1898956 RepID=UPI0025CE80F4|nr:maleylacetoacetate isomerase [Ottowia sp.]MBK6612768.1 maleylacetoacetate isomerase [Ottowia sp.]MBK6748104.1 maleylacetoacetate isomerase [Ottowia sp.]
MKLYSYFRSSASFRVRIALRLKGLAHDYVPVHLPRGEHQQPGFASLTAEQLVPVLELAGGQRLTQSMAIIEYLDEVHPQPPALLPADPLGRARVRALTQIVACEIHPLNNLRVLKYLVRDLQASDEAKNDWYRHWVCLGLASYEAHLAERPGTFSHGDTPTLADCCLVPQIFNAQRFDCDLSGLPLTLGVFDACMRLDAFQQAQPSACPDAE